METYNFDQKTLPMILCCLCGTPTTANDANMCIECIKTQIDITEGIPKQLPLHWCKGCGRYLNPPTQWLMADLESKELLSICLKKVKGLSKLKLIDAGFVWTEAHSRRVKVKLTVQKEVFTNTILQQMFVIEYVVYNQQCEHCQRYEAKDLWNALVQVRQHVEHKRTFFWLDQLIIKHGAYVNTTNIKETSDGVNFYYNNKSHAQKFVSFVEAVVPARYKMSEQLVSHDDKSNTANVKHVFSVEIAPVCRDDLICLPTKIAQQLGGICPLVLCTKITNLIQLIDPFSLKTVTINCQQYWQNQFRSLWNSRQLIQYEIIDVQAVEPVVQNGRFVLSDVTCARSSDFGCNDTMFVTRSHIPNLHPGDCCLGYDLASGSFNELDVSSLRKFQMPDVILVKKTYPKRRMSLRDRHWKLKNLPRDLDIEESFRKNELEKHAQDYERFLQELEEDPELRGQINLYKEKDAERIFMKRSKRSNTNNKQVNNNDDMMDEESDEEDFPEIQLTELLEDLEEMKIQDEEAEMVRNAQQQFQ